jgi:pimeloyl-ACP methyl ester carboxylesterase
MMRAGTLTVREGTLETSWWGPGPAEAPTIVLLHEGLGCVELWRDVPEQLAAATGWGVFGYSRFGYGRSDLTSLPRPMTYMQREALVVLPQVLRKAGIKQAVLLGHSDGGSIAAVYAGATNHPLPSLDFIMTNDTVEGAYPQTNLLGLVTIAAHFFVEDLNIASIRQIRDTYETGDLARYHRDVDVAFRGWNGAWLDPRFRDFNITGFLPGIRVPILGLQGADDPYGTDKQLHVLQANVSAPIEIELIPDARHAPHLEAKEPTLAAITRFIAGLSRDFQT